MEICCECSTKLAENQSKFDAAKSYRERKIRNHGILNLNVDYNACALSECYRARSNISRTHTVLKQRARSVLGNTNQFQ